jgi:hypothetical protein
LSSTTTVVSAVIDNLREGLGSHCRRHYRRPYLRREAWGPSPLLLSAAGGTGATVLNAIHAGGLGSRCCHQYPQPHLQWEGSNLQSPPPPLSSMPSAREGSGAAAAVAVLDRIHDGRSRVPPPLPSATGVLGSRRCRRCCPHSSRTDGGRYREERRGRRN